MKNKPVISAANTEVSSTTSEARVSSSSDIPLNIFKNLCALVPYLDRDISAINWISGNGLRYNGWVAAKELDAIQNRNETIWTMSPQKYDEIMSVVVMQSADVECKFMSKNSFLKVLKAYGLLQCNSGRYTIRKGLNNKPVIAIRRDAVLHLIDEFKKTQEVILRSMNPSPPSVNSVSIAREIIDTMDDANVNEEKEFVVHNAEIAELAQLHIDDENMRHLADVAQLDDDSKVGHLSIANNAEGVEADAVMQSSPRAGRKRKREDTENQNHLNVPIIVDDTNDISMTQLSLSPSEPPRKKRKRRGG